MNLSDDLSSLRQQARKFEINLVHALLDEGLGDIYAQELLSTLKGFSIAASEMNEDASTIRELSLEMNGKLDRIQATLRVLFATNKIGNKNFQELSDALQQLKDAIQALLRHA